MQKELCVPEKMLRQIIHNIDPINYSLRWNAILHRRTCSLTDAMFATNQFAN